MTISFLFGTNSSTFHLNYALDSMVNNPNSPCPRCKEREESHPQFTVHCRLSQTTLDYINKLINLNYTFRTPFRISIKGILMATSSRTHDGIKLEILQILIEVFLRHVNFCRRKAFYGDGYDKISELSNLKGNLVSCFNKLKDMSVELGSKERHPEHSVQLSLKTFDGPFSYECLSLILKIKKKRPRKHHNLTFSQSTWVCSDSNRVAL